MSRMFRTPLFIKFTVETDKCCRLHRTIWIVGLAQEEVVAGPGRVVLGTHGELHALNVLFEIAERPEYVLHSLRCSAVVGPCIGSLHLSLPSGSFAWVLDGERLDHVSRRTLQHRGHAPSCYCTWDKKVDSDSAAEGLSFKCVVFTRLS